MNMKPFIFSLIFALSKDSSAAERMSDRQVFFVASGTALIAAYQWAPLVYKWYTNFNGSKTISSEDVNEQLHLQLSRSENIELESNSLSFSISDDDSDRSPKRFNDGRSPKRSKTPLPPLFEEEEESEESLDEEIFENNKSSSHSSSESDQEIETEDDQEVKRFSIDVDKVTVL